MPAEAPRGRKISRREMLSLGVLGAAGIGISGYGAHSLINDNRAQAATSAPATPLGAPTDKALGAGTVTPATTDAPKVTDSSITNYEADENAMPVGWRDKGYDFQKLMEGISYGGGEGNPTINWDKMPASTLRIPQAQLSIPIVEKGGTYNPATGYWSMDVPVSFQAGWYNRSAPIEATEGATVIAGHINWADGTYAPMSNLYWAEPGMLVLLSTGSGKLIRAKIDRIEEFDQKDLSKHLNASGLPREYPLLTCLFDKAVENFTKNRDVIAVPI